MRNRTFRGTIPLLVLLVPVQAFALDWAARMGLLYSRDDAWTDSSPSTSRPHLDVDLALDIADFVHAPGTLSWRGGVAYRRVTDDMNGQRISRSDALSYRLSAFLFRNPTSPVRISGFAERTDGRIDTPQGLVATSDRTTERFGGTVALKARAVPSLELSYSRDSIDETIPTLPSHERRQDILSARTRQDANSLSFSAAYRGEWSDGTWVSDQYRQYSVQGEARGQISSRARLELIESYLSREPTTNSGSGFRIDANSFGAAYREGLVAGDILSVSFRSVHGLTETGSALAESIGHSGRYEQDFRLGESLYLIRGIADLSYTEQRTTVASLTGAGGTVGALLWWRRQVGQTLLEWNAGPLAGVLRVPGEDLRYGYGGAGAFRNVRPWGAYQLSLSYDVAFQRDTFGLRGWMLRQVGTVGLSGALGVGRGNAQLSAAASRQWTPTLGDDVRRSITFTGSYVTRRYSADAQVTLQSGVASVTTDGFVGDGIFLPTGFDSHTIGSLLGTTVELLPGLRARLQGRASSLHGLGQPDVTFLEALASLTYGFGALDLSLEDRYFTTRTAGGATNGNVLMVRASRAFGSRF